MGRYRKNKSKRKEQNGKHHEKSFNSMERDLLESYLSYYHHASNRACFPPDGVDSDDDETIRISNCQATSFENGPTFIRGHEFQALKSEVLEKPYLNLPSTLETKDRRIIYDLCIHTDLYHVGAGHKFKDRMAIVSPHPDGFYHTELEKPLHFPVLLCKPWFYRNDIGGICPSPRKGISFSSYTFSPHFLSRHKVRELTKKHRAIIENIMNYPYQCLRGKIDTEFTLRRPPKFDTSIHTLVVVDNAEKMKMCAKTLTEHKLTELAFDIEAYNTSKYKQATCLIQLCTNYGQEYVIDVLAPGVWNEVSLLQPIFADKGIVKIGHGISGVDIPCLHRDFGIFVVNVFDTLEAAIKLGLRNHLGLYKLCNYFNLEEDPQRHVSLKDIYQNCDWRERPLNDDQIEYSVKDVRYLIHLRRLLIRDLLEYNSIPSVVTKEEIPNKICGETSKFDFETDQSQSQDSRDNEKSKSSLDEDETSFFTAHDDTKIQTTCEDDFCKISDLQYNQTLMDVLRCSQQKCLSLWIEKAEPADKNETLIGLMRRAERLRNESDIKVFNNEDMSLYTELVEWREDVAKKVGIQASMLCPLNLLALVAYKRPGSMTSLKRLCYFLPIIFQDGDCSHHVEDLFSIIAAAGNDSLANTDAVVKLYSERIIKNKQPQSELAISISNSNDEEITDNSCESMYISTKSNEEELSQGAKKAMGNHAKASEPRYSKLLLTGLFVSIAIAWIKVTKNKK